MDGILHSSKMTQIKPQTKVQSKVNILKFFFFFLNSCFLLSRPAWTCRPLPLFLPRFLLVLPVETPTFWFRALALYFNLSIHTLFLCRRRPLVSQCDLIGRNPGTNATNHLPLPAITACTPMSHSHINSGFTSTSCSGGGGR